MINSEKTKKILIIFGTRPEAIKLAPVINEVKKICNVIVCITAQHREMLDQVLRFFSIVPHYDLNIMTRKQTLFDITIKSLKLLDGIVDKIKPDMIIVQGDTTTAFVGALTGYYKKIKVAHIEAGLRSFDKFSPFPEEINRVLISHLADYHFTPTKKAKQNLILENIPSKNIFVVGNTVIDALLIGLKIVNKDEKQFYEFFKFIDFSKKIILVTGHRRESFGEPFENICYALKEIAEDNVQIVYPVHLNPVVRKHVYSILRNKKNIHLIEPLEYPHFIWLMNKSYLILTDSGGIQEEAPTLGKPVLVMRNVTERTEGIEEGTSMLVTTDKGKIVESTRMLLSNQKEYNKMAMRKNPYGDGKSAKRISNKIKELI